MLFTKLTEDEFKKFSEFIKEKSGIFLKESKLTLLSNRLRKRLKEKKIDTFNEYFNYIVRTNDLNEIVEMLNVVSTNETFFFRHKNQFESLFDFIIPEMLSKNKYPIKIWSAGCSTGEEPYTIAMIAKERGLLDNRYLIIDASDLSTNVLNEAQIGRYDEKKLRETDIYYKNKYFTKDSNGFFKIDNNIIKSINFFRFNLMNDISDNHYNIVFCRNVLIYFDKEGQKKVVDMFYKSLEDDGYLFLGHSESLYFIDNRFKYKKIVDSPIYYKE